MNSKTVNVRQIEIRLKNCLFKQRSRFSDLADLYLFLPTICNLRIPFSFSFLTKVLQKIILEMLEGLCLE